MTCLNDTVSLSDVLCPTHPEQHYFTEIIICEHLYIPPQKPDKELITNVIKNFVVTSAEVITVDLGDREKKLRKKLVISGTLKLGIEYSADMPEQQVHFAHWDIPFQGIIGYRPCDPYTNRGLIDDPDFDIEDYKIHICLEHEQYHQLSKREIKAVLVLLIWLEKK
ncbi:protein of unknown function [Thermosyntropha lipolytica DSM 11003]|uniref:SipL SPOCS domain-containing protein n=1 Tax=Thermosyntropha lipolytica DSM 11003 TaxID=1123382 RepID=A0A1M5NFU8_9FIRM|nr:SPOCS domain-containing protein [Thermosyntropha lipolytica]SHG88335.1 protein of unknown function [Thermosyntropha lipolytica DSM 11003]